jgi:hypothetical protein
LTGYVSKDGLGDSEDAEMEQTSVSSIDPDDAQDWNDSAMKESSDSVTNVPLLPRTPSPTIAQSPYAPSAPKETAPPPPPAVQEEPKLSVLEKFANRNALIVEQLKREEAAKAARSFEEASRQAEAEEARKLLEVEPNEQSTMRAQLELEIRRANEQKEKLDQMQEMLKACVEERDSQVQELGGLQRQQALDESAIAKLKFLAHDLLDAMPGSRGGKSYSTSRGPLRLDASDSYFAKQALKAVFTDPDAADQDTKTPHTTDTISNISSATALDDPCGLPPKPKYHILFPPASSNTKSVHVDAWTRSLESHGIEPYFELRSSDWDGSIFGKDRSLPRSVVDRRTQDKYVSGAIVWGSLSVYGQSELYSALNSVGWNPVYVRSCGRCSHYLVCLGY